MLTLVELELLAGGRASLEVEESLSLCLLESPLRRPILMRLWKLAKYLTKGDTKGKKLLTRKGAAQKETLNKNGIAAALN